MKFAAVLICYLCAAIARCERGVAPPKVREHPHPRPRGERHVAALLERAKAAKLNATIVHDVAAAGAEAVKTGDQLKAAAAAKAKLSPKGWFTFTITMAFVVKVLCMMSNVLFQVSPLPVVKKFCDDRDTGEADGAPYFSILYNGWQWCFYGTYAFAVTQKSGFLVLVYSNALGALLGIYYLWGFMENCKVEQTLSRLHVYFRVAAVLVLVQICAMSALPCEKALFLCGFVSSLCGVMVSMSMLATVPVIFKTCCSATVNVPMLCIGICSNTLWLICGYMLHDLWISIPNIVGLMVFFFSLGLARRFPRDPKIAAALVAARSESSPLLAESSPLMAIRRTLSGLSGGSAEEGHAHSPHVAEEGLHSAPLGTTTARTWLSGLGGGSAEEGTRSVPLAARPRNYGSIGSIGSDGCSVDGGICGDTGGTF